MFRVSCKEMGHFPMAARRKKNDQRLAQKKGNGLKRFFGQIHQIPVFLPVTQLPFKFVRKETNSFVEIRWWLNMSHKPCTHNAFTLTSGGVQEWFYSPLFDMAHMRSLLVRHLNVECHFLGADRTFSCESIKNSTMWWCKNMLQLNLLYLLYCNMCVTVYIFYIVVIVVCIVFI